MTTLNDLQKSVDELNEILDRRNSVDAMRDRNYANLLTVAQAVLDELEDRYDGAPDSTTLWMTEPMEALRKAVALAGGAA